MGGRSDDSGRFSDVTDRLDEIICAVRDKDTSLEQSLDLFDEAIALGTRAVDLVDKAALSPEELARLTEKPAADDIPSSEETASVADDAAAVDDAAATDDGAATDDAAATDDGAAADDGD